MGFILGGLVEFEHEDARYIGRLEEYGEHDAVVYIPAFPRGMRVNVSRETLLPVIESSMGFPERHVSEVWIANCGECARVAILAIDVGKHVLVVRTKSGEREILPEEALETLLGESALPCGRCPNPSRCSLA